MLASAASRPPTTDLTVAAGRYDVLTLPTVILFRDGRIIDRKAGLMSADIYFQTLKAMIDGGVDARAAAAVVQPLEGFVQRGAHRPPSSTSRSSPRSGWLGSSSSRAISRRPTFNSPAATASVAGRFWRRRRRTSAQRTPGTPCAAA